MDPGTDGVGVLGLGARGRPVTEHLLRRPDTPVAIHGRGRDLYADPLDAGARWHDTACAVAAESSVVLLMLPDLPQVEEVRRTLHTTTNNPPRFRSDPGSASGSQERVRHADQEGNRQCASSPSDIGTTPPAEGGALERAVGPAQLRRRGHLGKFCELSVRHLDHQRRLLATGLTAQEDPLGPDLLQPSARHHRGHRLISHAGLERCARSDGVRGRSRTGHTGTGVEPLNFRAAVPVATVLRIYRSHRGPCPSPRRAPVLGPVALRPEGACPASPRRGMVSDVLHTAGSGRQVESSAADWRSHP